MSNFLNLLKTIYTKEQIEVTDDIGLCIALTNTLSKDKDNLEFLRKVSKYLFLIEPKHYFLLLYFNIPKKSFIPKMMKFDKKDEKTNLLYKEIAHFLKWSNRELSYNSEILNAVILKDEEYWKAQLGVK